MDILMFKTISKASKLTYKTYEIDFNMITYMLVNFVKFH